MVETESAVAVCPGCALVSRSGASVSYEGHYRASPECWAVYADVIGVDFSNVVLFARAHQLTVDAYAAQHAGGEHGDKSVCVHLVGLHLQIEEGLPGPRVAHSLRRFAERVDRRGEWPHFDVPSRTGALTIADVAGAPTMEDHVETVAAWAYAVWDTWIDVHDDVATLALEYDLV